MSKNSTTTYSKTRKEGPKKQRRRERRRAVITGEYNETKKLRPLIKWTGGKYDEYPHFAQYIPLFTNYYEPFAGGAGVFFALQPKGKAFLNDVSTNLMQFYRLHSSKTFHKELLLYADAWESIKLFASEVGTTIVPLWKKFLASQLSTHALKDAIAKVILNIQTKTYSSLFHESVLVNLYSLLLKTIDALCDKIKRIKRIRIKEGSVFSHTQLLQQIETACKSAFYVHLRELFNQNAKGDMQVSKEKATALWYMVRELCYASMFRYNKVGEFNIPYGGTSYNSKNIRAKVEAIGSAHVQQILQKVSFSQLDFEAFLHTTKPSNDDFVFVDPPYDTAFTSYDQKPFDHEDHIRLRSSLNTLKAKWLMVIKDTPFIRRLYETSSYTIHSFYKMYIHNIKGRNKRMVRHLIIMNYII